MNIQPGWFVLNFDNFHVMPGEGLPEPVWKLVDKTITTLRLNRDDRLVEVRFEIVRDYSNGNVTLEFLRGRYPFFAAELERQGLTEAIKGIFP